MRRRDLFALLAGAGTLWPILARAQARRPYRIGYLGTGTRASVAPFLAEFREGLRTFGYGDQELAMEIRYADGHIERLPGLAAELVGLAPEVIVAPGATATRAAKRRPRRSPSSWVALPIRSAAG